MIDLKTKESGEIECQKLNKLKKENHFLSWPQYDQPFT